MNKYYVDLIGTTCAMAMCVRIVTMVYRRRNIKCKDDLYIVSMLYE